MQPPEPTDSISPRVSPWRLLLSAALLLQPGCSGDESVLPETDTTTDSDDREGDADREDDSSDSDESDESDDDGAEDEDIQLASSYSADCNGYQSKLSDCRVLSEGDFQCEDPSSPQEECAYECLTLASCSILSDNACNGLVPAPLERCLTNCFSFECDDGGLISLSWECDGTPDCGDGSDEIDCVEFECDSGETFTQAYVCDFVEDCADGSDEVNCDGFVCGSGEVYPAWYACDREADCLDGSDEEDCEFFECDATGELLPLNWQCDQVDDCLDGSDETGCAAYQCR